MNHNGEQIFPLISCIMPTYNRRAFVPHAIRYFLRQDYSEKELIILDDGTDCIQDLVPEHPLIRYQRLPEKLTLGSKMNMACEMARGTLIANWDDDDWYAPHRLRYQREAMKQPSYYICGINRLLYLDLASKDAFEYIYPANQRTWLLGSSLCFRKDFWRDHPFAAINVGMDGLFVWSTTKEHIKVLEDHTFSVHMIHPHNISPKQTNSHWWHRRNPEQLSSIMGDDWPYYNLNGSWPLPHTRNVAGHKLAAQKKEKKVVDNVFACLVHENKECIADLVRNLYHHDPSSVILLYNGGNDPTLHEMDFSFIPAKVYVYPEPEPMKWGYLHHFALQCMEYADTHFIYQSFTIVDSDQLCLRKGYGEFISAYLKSKPGVGMLSSVAGRIPSNDHNNPVAMQAYKEFELWEPFLQTFPDGVSKFVHWTFWPSTVFSAEAAKSLVTLFKENKQLQTIMQQTKIWATEEVIFPTLVALLGYEVALNPCSFAYVKYKTTFTLLQTKQALAQSSVYWIHPVSRKYLDPVRVGIRKLNDDYRLSIPVSHPDKTDPGLSHNTIIRSVQHIPGWLSDIEANLLLSSCVEALNETGPEGVVVETGSYQGKATVLLAMLLKRLRHEQKVYAFDTHDGKLGDAVQGLKTYPPSGERFQQHIRKAGVMDHVQPVSRKTAGISWKLPVAFLFIDWLHDYENVRTDFNAFTSNLMSGALVAFHDYAPYFPGVMRFVDELIQSGTCKVKARAESLIILKKNNTTN